MPEVNFEYPVRKDVAASNRVKSWGDFAPDTLHLTASPRSAHGPVNWSMKFPLMTARNVT